MAKDIIFCADGTWNGPGNDDGPDLSPDSTNVLKVFSRLDGIVSPESLRLRDEQEKSLIGANGEPLQIAKYLHGVGDSRNGIIKILGGVFGEGFVERIVRGYTFVSRNYVPGDRVHLIGFSRGAYTARALGGMILGMGLLDGEKTFGAGASWEADLAYKMGISVWTQYRKHAGKSSPLLGYLAEFHSVTVGPALLRDCDKLSTIAVWDTVGSLGIPVYGGVDADRVDVFKFADQDLSPRVEAGLHAISIDECRADFEPTLWNDRPGVTQVWFSGAHADVGGGYPEAVLSDISLAWMTGALKARGLHFSNANFELKDPFVAHHAPWLESPFNLRPPVARTIPDFVKFHPSVQARLTGYADYKPGNISNWLNGGRQLPPGVMSQ